MRGFIVLMAGFLFVCFAAPAEAVLIAGIIGEEDVSMHDCLGWSDSTPSETYDYEYIAGGERIRIKITVDDDDDEVQTCDILVTADDGDGHVFTIYDSTVHDVYDDEEGRYVTHGTGVWGQGTHRFQRKLPADLAGNPAGSYSIKIKATVVTPVAEAGTEETESDTVDLYKKKKWNLLVYVAGENSLANNAVSDLEEMDDDDTTA